MKIYKIENVNIIKKKKKKKKKKSHNSLNEAKIREKEIREKKSTMAIQNLNKNNIYFFLFSISGEEKFPAERAAQPSTHVSN